MSPVFPNGHADPLCGEDKLPPPPNGNPDSLLNEDKLPTLPNGNPDSLLNEDKLPPLPNGNHDSLLNKEKLPSLPNDMQSDTTIASENMDEFSEHDAGGFGKVGSTTNTFMSMSVNENAPKVGTARDATEYYMKHPQRGYCLVFNHSDFDSSTGLSRRGGSNRDRDEIKACFGKLGFNVQVFNNLTVKEIYKVLRQFSYEIDHTNSDCLAVFFLSHGESDQLYARDYMFETDKLFRAFTADNCRTLAGKPKMFFIQACRGNNMSEAVTVVTNRDQTDGAELTSYKIPPFTDFLISYSTVQNNYSWRNTSNGSWFIQSIVKVFMESSATTDVLSMMTDVNRNVVLSFESNCPSSILMHGKKQTGIFHSTLMRRVYLTPKL